MEGCCLGSWVFHSAASNFDARLRLLCMLLCEVQRLGNVGFERTVEGGLWLRRRISQRRNELRSLAQGVRAVVRCAVDSERFTKNFDCVAFVFVI